MQKVRIALRGKAVVLMGKNTLIRTVIRENLAKTPNFESLLPHVVGNVGFVFTNHNLNEVRRLVLDNKVPAAAKSGSYAPDDVMVPAGPTGLDPGQTNFFQALNIATKIVKGTIEIVNNVNLIKKGDRVTSSHVALLGKLNILPFFYGFGVTLVYEDGTMYDAAILDMSQDDLLQKFFAGARKLAAVSLAISYPTQASLSHLINGAFKKLVCIALVTAIDFKEAKSFKEFDPSKVVAAAPAAAAGKSAAPKAEEKPKEKSEESEADMGFSLFD
jgi:large subunit ribosomal protein LP0